jgi:hypothetical protein
MKKFISLFSALCVGMAFSMNVLGATGTIVNGKTMVPVRGVFEQLGFDVTWNSSTETATIYNSQTSIEIPKGKTYFYVNGTSFKPDVPQQVINGSLYIPLRAIADSINADTSWNSEQKMAHISYNGCDVYVSCAQAASNQTSTLESQVPKYEVYPAGLYENGVTISFSVYSSPDGAEIGNIIYGDLYDAPCAVLKTGVTNIYTVAGGVLNGAKIAVTDNKLIISGTQGYNGTFVKTQEFIS